MSVHYLNRWASCARHGAIKETFRKDSGAVPAVVLPFRVAETATMKRESVYPYTEKEAPGVNVHKLRVEMGLSQRALGDKCRPPLDHTTIRRLENNKGYTQDTLERVARALRLERYQDLFLPPELFEYTHLSPQAKERIAAAITDAAVAERYKKKI